MRWWLNTDHKMFSVDNAGVRGLDFSTLPPDVWMVQWTDGKGEIERQDADGKNLNGLREDFIDIIPYAPFFQQFLTLLPGLTLPQAKKVQIELIEEVYNSKRQAPFHYPIAAGDYWWDATDATLFSSLIPSLQNAIASINAIVAALNEKMPALGAADASIYSQVNSNVVAVGDAFVGQVNANVVAPGNGLRDEINANIVNGINSTVVGGVNSAVVGGVNTLVNDINTNIVGPNRAMKDEIGGVIVNPVNALITYVDDTVLGTFAGPGGANTINGKLLAEISSGTPPGLNGNIVHFDSPLAYLSASCYSTGVAAIGGISSIGGVGTSFLGITADFIPVVYAGNVPWTPLPNVPTSNVTWIPIGSTVPVNVTPAEQAAIMSGITARSNDLLVKKNIKVGEVKALTTIPAVIAYDVTTGW